MYIFLPIYLTAYLKFLSFRLLVIFYSANIFIVFHSLWKNSRNIHHLQFQIQDLQEKINILNDQNSQGFKNKVALQEKISRYGGLKKIIEEINQNLNLDYIATNLAAIAFLLIADNKGTAILYLVDSQTQRPKIFKTKKEDKELIIKAKEGDIFDLWVLRHTQPLLIEDIKKDFRFDLTRFKKEERRPISSLISAPFISSNRLLGILRLDSAQMGSYAQDDLRFLVTICDLGAVALENAELYQKAQDLAIHDGLTSLYTKGYFLERLREECRRSIRQGAALSLLMLDIDYFKNYNDKFGHSAGDIVLRNLSQEMVEFLKGLHPIVGRFGGEEFCIILARTDKQEACDIGRALRARIEKIKIILRREETFVTVSVGIATFPVDANDENELILKADRAMYEAKQKGRNRVCLA